MVIWEGSELKEEGELPAKTIQEINNTINLHLLADAGTSPSTRTGGTPIPTLHSSFSYKEVSYDFLPGDPDRIKAASTNHIPVKPGGPTTNAIQNTAPERI